MTDQTEELIRELYPEHWTDVSRQPGELHRLDIEPAISRLTDIRTNRRKRIKGLGNAIVPEIVFLLFKRAKQFLEAG